MDIDVSPSRLDPVDELAEQYLRRRRRGEHPTPAEYAARYPEHAARILELFPALELIEGLKHTPDDHIGCSGDAGGGVEPAGGARRPRRLGDYTLLREIGRGGMGIVYEAEHESLKNRVALKVMHPRFRADRTYIRGFQTVVPGTAYLTAWANSVSGPPTFWRLGNVDGPQRPGPQRPAGLAFALGRVRAARV
jgi:eukaryotic-like serine/threonine-protein kinase